jgi:hypothetical protein
MLEEMVARQPPSAGSRPVAIGSRYIAVSLQPAIPRRVAPQQSPLPLHRSPTIVAQSRSGEAVKCAAQPHCKDAVQRFAVTALSRRAHPPPMGCHLYFARRVTFLSCADSVSPSPAVLDNGPAPNCRAFRPSGTPLTRHLCGPLLDRPAGLRKIAFGSLSPLCKPCDLCVRSRALRGLRL